VSALDRVLEAERGLIGRARLRLDMLCRCGCDSGAAHAAAQGRLLSLRAKSRIRARLEHVFGSQQSAPGGRIVRTIGMVRARAKIGLQNLAYNIRRLVTLERLAAA
jgi:hypothetical protein